MLYIDDTKNNTSVNEAKVKWMKGSTQLVLLAQLMYLSITISGIKI